MIVDRLRVATPLAQTFSAGVALWRGDETADQLVARADKALYQAQRGHAVRLGDGQSGCRAVATG